MKKRSYNSEKVKNDILVEASALFAQKGYAQTSVADISNASGYSKGHIYYHFGNKEKLFVRLAQNTMQHWYKKWQEKEDQFTTATEKLYGIAKYVLYHYQTPLLKAGQELAANPNAHPESIKKLYDLAITPMSTYRSIFQMGMDNDEFKHGDIEQWTTLFGTWLGGLCQLTNTQQLKSLEPLFEQSVTIFLGHIKK